MLSTSSVIIDTIFIGFLGITESERAGQKLEMNDKKRMRVHPKHWDLLLQHLELHPELLTGKFNCQNAKQTSKELWNDVARQLNSLGLGKKTAEKWKIALQDWKYKIKMKIAVMKESRYKTGGDPPTTVTLTDQEERLMSFVGWSSVGNENIPESGLSQPTLDEQSLPGPSTSQLLPTQRVDVIPDHQYIIEETVEFQDVTDEPMEGIGINEEPSTSSTLRKTSTPRKKKPRKVISENEVLHQYQQETMTVLNNISDSVGNISNGIDRVASELKDISQLFKRYLDRHDGF